MYLKEQIEKLVRGGRKKIFWFVIYRRVECSLNPFFQTHEQSFSNCIFQTPNPSNAFNFETPSTKYIQKQNCSQTLDSRRKMENERWRGNSGKEKKFITRV